MKKVFCLICSFLVLFSSMVILADESTPELEEGEGFYFSREGDCIVIRGVVLRTYKVTKLSVPATIGGTRVELGKEAFRGLTEINKIIFEEGINVIPEGLCRDMVNLQKVVLPVSVEAIGDYAFKDCPKLDEINLLYVTKIGEGAFDGTQVNMEATKQKGEAEAEKINKLKPETNVHIGVTVEYSDVEKGTDLWTCVDTLTRLGVMEGYGADMFCPEKTLTRAEAAAVMIRLLNLNHGIYQRKTIFSDVESSHWASGYISAANDWGIMNGFGYSTFLPDECVTYHQMIKMLVCALGYQDFAEYKGGWTKDGYLYVAKEIGLCENVVDNKDDFITRGDVAGLCYKALTIELGDRSSDGGKMFGHFYALVDQTILTEYWECEKLEGVIRVEDGKLLIKVTKRFDEESSFLVGQVLTLEPMKEEFLEFEDETVIAYVKKTEKGKNSVLFLTEIEE